MTRLTLARKKEDGLAILMLHAGERLAGHVRDIHLLLAGRMRVQPDTDIICGGFDRDSIRPFPEQTSHTLKVFRQQHARLRKSQLDGTWDHRGHYPNR